MSNDTNILAGRLINGRYRIIKTLGVGGMASVYLGEDTYRSRTLVAIKEMLRAINPIEKTKYIGQFGREANFLTNLNHTNLPKLYEFFFENEIPYLVMEYIEGKTLQSILDERTDALEEKNVIEWGIQICEVLKYLHNQNPRPIIFRDLKLTNIMLTKDGKIKLIDFGIAREYNPRKNTDTIRMGSLGYAPPEQYSKGGQTDVRTDVYALGVCLHSLLTKSDPSATPFSFRNIKNLNPSISQGLNRLIMKSLEINPEKRFQTITELQESLREELPGPGIKITPPVLNLGEISKGEKKIATVVISNNKDGHLKGIIKEISFHGIKPAFTTFESNYQELTFEIDISDLNNHQSYSETITFESNGGDREVGILFTVVPSGPRLEIDVSFIDFGSLKYNKDTSCKIDLYNTGGGILDGRITTDMEWIKIDPSEFKGNQENVNIAVIPQKLKNKPVYEGHIIIESNGGNRTLEVILFKPLLNASHNYIDLGVLSFPKNNTFILGINNNGKGNLEGDISCKSPWVKLSSNLIKGNNNIIEITIENEKLIRGKKVKSEIQINSNGGNISIPITAELYSPIKTAGKLFFIFFLTILFCLSNYIRYNLEEKSRLDFLFRLSNIKSQIVYYYMDINPKIYIIKPDGREKRFLTRGYYPSWMPDGKKIIFFSENHHIKLIDIENKKCQDVTEGVNPVLSFDAKKIALEKGNGLINIIVVNDLKEFPLTYGKNPCWSPEEEKIVYNDEDKSGSSIKLISLKNPEPVFIGKGFNPIWSPDGRYIIYNINKETLSIIDSNKFVQIFLIDGVTPAWSSDGKKIAFEYQGYIYIMDLETGKKTKIIPGRQPAWSPDNNYLALSYNGIYIFHISEGMEYKIAPCGSYPKWSP